MNHRKFDLYFTETAGSDCQPGIASIRRLDAGLSAWSSRSTLYNSERMAIGVARSRATSSGSGPEATAQAHTISIVTRGVYRAHVGDRSHVVDATTAGLFNTGDRFRVSHPHAVGDESIFLQFAEELVQEALHRHGLRDEPARFPLLTTPLGAGAFISIRSLLTHLQRDSGLGELSSAVIEETALGVLDDIASSAANSMKRELIAARKETASLHVDLTERAKAILASAPKDRSTIAEIANTLVCSPYHLCRVFRAHTGQPVHRYLNSLRLRLAIDRLCDPKEDLRGIAEDLGYASHSHFCDSFKREFGASPSLMRSRMNDVRSLVNVG